MPSEAVDVDRGQFVGRRLSHVAFVVDLHELSPVGRWATGGRDGRWFERFAEMCQALISRGQSHPGLLPLANLRFEVCRLLPAVCDESDVATTPRALGGNSSPTRAMSLAFGVARCRGRVVCCVSRSSRRWHLRPPHVR